MHTQSECEPIFSWFLMDVTKRFEHFRKIWDFFPQSAPKGQQKPLVPAKLIFMDGGWVYAQIIKPNTTLFICISTFSHSSFFFFAESVAQNKFNRKNPSNRQDAKKVGLKSGVGPRTSKNSWERSRPGLLPPCPKKQCSKSTPDLSPTFFASRWTLSRDRQKSHVKIGLHSNTHLIFRIIFEWSDVWESESLCLSERDYPGILLFSNGGSRINMFFSVSRQNHRRVCVVVCV